MTYNVMCLVVGNIFIEISRFLPLLSEYTVCSLGCLDNSKEKIAFEINLSYMNL